MPQDDMLRIRRWRQRVISHDTSAYTAMLDFLYHKRPDSYATHYADLLDKQGRITRRFLHAHAYYDLALLGFIDQIVQVQWRQLYRNALCEHLEWLQAVHHQAQEDRSIDMMLSLCHIYKIPAHRICEIQSPLL
mgnify:FL=1